MALSQTDLVDARRYAGYPAFGGTNSGQQSWRFFQAYGQLEFRLANLTAEEYTVIGTFLANLRTLEQAILTAASNLDTQRAAVWQHNPNEIADRRRLYDYQRKELCGFLGVPFGPYLGQGASGRIVI